MSSDRKLSDLKNIGRKIAARLEAIGIHSESDLRAVGAVETHRRIKALYPDAPPRSAITCMPSRGR